MPAADLKEVLPAPLTSKALLITVPHPQQHWQWKNLSYFAHPLICGLLCRSLVISICLLDILGTISFSHMH
jgi:hypothetical protein